MSAFFLLCKRAAQLGAGSFSFKADAHKALLDNAPTESWRCKINCERKYYDDHGKTGQYYVAHGRTGEEALQRAVRLMEKDLPSPVREALP